jgi:hypothetical protein
MAIKIRLAKSKDIPALFKLEKTFPGDRLSRSSFDYFLRSKAEVWVLEEDSHGCIRWWLHLKHGVKVSAGCFFSRLKKRLKSVDAVF